MTIALLCPTLGRPEQCKRMMDSAYLTSTEHITIHLALEEYYDFINKYELPRGSCGFKTIQTPAWPTVMKWNHLATFPDAEDASLVMLCSDDVIFENKGWDVAITKHYNNLKNKIHCYALQDSRDHNGTPHIILTREWIEAMGWFLPPYFMHFFCDTWTVEMAKANNCFTHMRDYILRHDKPSDAGKPDQTHLSVRQAGWDKRDRYVARNCSYILELEKQRLAKAMQ